MIPDIGKYCVQILDINQVINNNSKLLSARSLVKTRCDQDISQAKAAMLKAHIDMLSHHISRLYGFDSFPFRSC